jgi:hypothetical protein
LRIEPLGHWAFRPDAPGTFAPFNLQWLNRSMTQSLGGLHGSRILIYGKAEVPPHRAILARWSGREENDGCFRISGETIP